MVVVVGMVAPVAREMLLEAMGGRWVTGVMMVMVARSELKAAEDMVVAVTMEARPVWAVVVALSAAVQGVKETMAVAERV